MEQDTLVASAEGEPNLRLPAFSLAVERRFYVLMCVIGEVSNPLLVREEVAPARKLVLTSRREEGGCVSNRRSTRYIRTDEETKRQERRETRIEIT